MKKIKTIETNESVKVSKCNGKLGDLIPCVDLPPIITCCNNCSCKKGCYACKGHYLFNDKKISMLNNLNIYLKDSNNYFLQIQNYLNNGLTIFKFFRWHSAGDIVNDDYLQGMIQTALKCKNTTFLCFTKKFKIINDYIANGGAVPKNLKIVFSAWDKDFIMDNPFAFPVAYIDFKNKSKNVDIPKKAFKCTGSCAECLHCWYLRKNESVVFNQH